MAGNCPMIGGGPLDGDRATDSHLPMILAVDGTQYHRHLVVFGPDQGRYVYIHQSANCSIAIADYLGSIWDAAI